MNKVKNVFTGQKSDGGQVDASQFTSESFTLLRKFLFSFQFLLIHFSRFSIFISHSILHTDFADEMKKARKIGTFKDYMVGRSSEVTFTTAFEKYEAIIRYLAAFDYTGEVPFSILLLYVEW
jgi:hypothetical protein